MNYNLIFILIVILLIMHLHGHFTCEKFASSYESIVFISKSCPACINYINNNQDQIKSYSAANNINLQTIYADDDVNKLFELHNITYVPCCIIKSNNKSMIVDGELNLNNYIKTLKMI